MNNKTENNAYKGGASDYDEAVELSGHGCYNYLLLFACCVTINAVALDMFGYSVVVAASSCDLQLGLTEAGVLASAPFAGVLFAFPWGCYADTRGRRRALLLSTSVGLLFAAISSISASWQFMFVAKLLGCTFSSASFTLTMTLLGECTGARHRSRYLFILNSVNLVSELITFTLAYLILPLDFKVPIPWLSITYRPWRLFTLVQALPLGVGAILMLFLHESPKFLANRGDNVKALEVLKRIYQCNGGCREEYPVKHILTTDTPNQVKFSFWSSLAKQTVPIFKPPLVWRTLQLFYLMAICCSTNNVFVMWFPTIVNIFFNSFTEGWTNDKTFCQRVFADNTTSIVNTSSTENFICNDTISYNTIYAGMAYGLFFGAVSLATAGLASRRRLVLITTLLISGVSCTMMDLSHPVANMTFFILLQCTAVGIGSVASYFVDVYPTSYRGLATSLGMMVARQFSFTGVNVIGAVITDYCSITFYCWALFVFSGVIVSLFLPSDRKTNKP